jgi:protein associated with RNAse G/E
MEILSFAFGVLSMIGLLLVIVIIIGAVKVLKQQKTTKYLERDLDVLEEKIFKYIDAEIQMIHNRADHMERDFPRMIDETVIKCSSYTDKRVDKLIDAHIETKETKQTKKLIKG